MKAIVLLSGGIDSAVMLGIALKKNRDCLALSFDYGQRHRIELESAKALCAHYNVPHKIIHIDPAAMEGSALVSDAQVPKFSGIEETVNLAVPTTYVPARNSLFLAYAMGQAELIGAREIYFGPNADDIGPYPDCRPAFVDAFQEVLRVGTKQSLEQGPLLITPLIEWDKRRIIEEGRELGVPLDITWSCYDPQDTSEGPRPCERCLACTLRMAASGEVAKA